MKLNSLIIIIALTTIFSSFSMQKRPIEMAAESSQPKRTKIARIAPIIGQSWLERITFDVQAIILEQLIELGQDAQETQNIAQTIRNVMSASKSLRGLAYSEDINKTLIGKLAQNRANGDLLDAAIILHTPGASRWFFWYIFEKWLLASDDEAALLLERINTCLLKALQCRDTAAALFILKSFGQLLQLDKYGQEVFLEACTYGNLEIVKLCIKNGCSLNSVNGNGNTPIGNAILGENLEIVQELMHTGLTISEESFMRLLHNAIINGRETIAIFLLNNRNDLIETSRVNNTPSWQISDLFRDSLVGAINHNFTEVVKLLITQEFKFRYGAKGLIFYAINHPEILQLLIQSDYENINATDHTYHTPLIRAAKGSKLESVKLLLQAKAKVNKSDFYGKTALIGAVQRGSPISIDIIKLLLAVPEIDLNARDNKDKTALMWAEELKTKSRDEIVSLLKNAGAQ